MKCPRCGKAYHSRYDICKNCYFELKAQFKKEALEERKKNENLDRSQWSTNYRIAVDETLRYCEDRDLPAERILSYYIEKYTYYKMLQFFAPIHEQNRKNAAEFSKYFMEQLKKHSQNE